MVERVRPTIREGGQELRRLIYRTLAPEPEIATRVTNAFRSMLLIGPMNRGKTSWAEAILGETIQYLVEEHGVDEAAIGYVYAEATDINRIVEEMARVLDLARLTYLFIFSDDAVASEGQHGRRAISRANVEVSKFYVRIRHILREKYGYSKAITAIHATQVYHLIDKTFREATDIDVLKALPKSQVDRKQIASLIHPDYVGATFGFLRSLGRKRLLAETLQEFLEAVYTAVVVVDGVPFVVRAFHDKRRIQEEVEARKTWLRRVQNLRVGGEPGLPEDRGPADEPSTTSTDIDYGALHYVLMRIWEHARLESRGADMLVEFPAGARLWIRKSILDAAGLLGNGKSGG